MIRTTPLLFVTCCLATLVAACDSRSPSSPEIDSPGATDTDQQSAFRLRQDFSAALNADSGWAAGLNDAATVFTDEPFRLRIEVQAGGNAPPQPRRYQLEYQRNGGDWQGMPAENFPQPAKVLTPDLTADPAEVWQFSHGNAASATVVHDEDRSFLRLSAGEQAVTAIGNYEDLWDAVEFAVDIRLPAGATSGAGLVFGVIDAQNYNQVVLGTEGSVRFERIVNGAATPIADATTTIATDRDGHFSEAELVEGTTDKPSSCARWRKVGHCAFEMNKAALL